ncbi:MAG: hypothetical protein H7Y32_18895, partial [Chloroflexales bacterium]|nr:hypothetical protein [Chloroflexales bacterium]
MALHAEFGSEPFGFSGDGRFVATVKSTTVQVWNADTGALVRSLTAKESSSIFFLNAVARSPDGALVAAGGVFGQSLWLWNLADGRRIELDAAGTAAIGGVSSLRFSPDGRVLVSGDNGVAWLWRTSDNTLLDPLGDERILTSGAFSPAGDMLGLVYSDTVTLWRTSDETTLRTISTGQGVASVVAFSANGETLAVLSDGGSVSLWRTSDGAPLGTLASMDTESNVRFVPDGQTLATITGSTVRLWRASDMG